MESQQSSDSRPARVDLDELSDLNVPVVVDRAEHAAVADGLTQDKGVRPVVEERDEERRAPV